MRALLDCHVTLLAVGTFIAAMLAPRELHAAPRTERRPNVILILADDLGPGDLGCYGQTKIRTPNIDRLAAEGMRFTRHYAGNTVCAPSRCCLLTGLHPGHAPIRGNRGTPPEGQLPLPAGSTTVGQVFQRAGYRTACIGKWGLGMPANSGDPNRNGFELFFGYLCQSKAHDHYPDYLWRNGQQVMLTANHNQQDVAFAHDALTKEALQFIRAAKDQPFFLYLPYTIPHLALQVPEDSLAEYRGQWDDPPYVGGKGYRPHPTPRAAYAGMVTRMDRDIGRLLNLIKELNLDNDTLVLFSSDNGPTFDVGGADSPFFGSAEGRRGLKGSLYEGGIRTPLVARWPGRIKPGAINDHLSAFWDFLPTCAELLGVAAPAGIDGISYLPSLLGKPQPPHEFLYWEIAEGRMQQAVRKGNWKGVYNWASQTFELFDLDADPREQTNLAAQNPAKARELRDLIKECHRDNPAFPLRAAVGKSAGKNAKKKRQPPP